MSETNIKKKLCNRLYSVKVDNINVKSEFQIDYENALPVPNSLVKYYALSDYSVDAITQSYLYASHPHELNDPFDCFFNLISYENLTLKMYLDFGTIIGGLTKKRVRDLYHNNKAELTEIIEEFIYNHTYSRFGIISMTTNSLDMQMWAHYTAHRGFLISFNSMSLASSELLHGPFPLNYVDNAEILNLAYNIDLVALYQSNIKSKSWKGEKEWRFLLDSPERLKLPNRKDLWQYQKDRQFHYNIESIDEIILGFSFFDRNCMTYFDNSVGIFDFKKSRDCKNIVKLLDFFTSNAGLKIKLIQIQNNLEFKLTTREISIEKVSKKTYMYKYIE